MTDQVKPDTKAKRFRKLNIRDLVAWVSLQFCAVGIVRVLFIDLEAICEAMDMPGSSILVVLLMLTLPVGGWHLRKWLCE